jgi:ESS family glutamate:Na+ symporter
MHGSIPIYFQALFLASVFALLAEIILSLAPVLKRIHIPRSFLGGIIALLLGPQVFGKLHDFNIITNEIQDSWNVLALFFVNVIFASVFLGRKIPNFKTSMKLAIPQAALGQTLAWGQYMVGGLITLIVLIPVFNLDESVASFIEICFQGGVGVAVGMGDTFESIGINNAKSITVALAPLAMLTGVLSGIVLINLNKKRKTNKVSERVNIKESKEESSTNRYQDSLIIQIAIIGISILLGVLLLNLLEFIENKVLIKHLYDNDFVKYIPLFPLALLGGAAIQLLFDRFIPIDIINRKTVKKIQVFALDAVIIMAIGTLNLAEVGNNFLVIIILLSAGFLWNISCFLLTYKVLIPKYPFERGIADYGQSMGTTSIGLMLQSIVDKNNESKGKEAFGIKQLLFEPFVGGGLITGLSPILIKNIGLIYFTSISFVLTIGFFLAGYFFNKK